MRRDSHYKMSKSMKRLLTTTVNKSDYNALKNIIINGEIESSNKRPRSKNTQQEDKTDAI